MLDFDYLTDSKTGKQIIQTSLKGKPLLTTPQLNKGTAFTQAERNEFSLLGKLPSRVETLEEQAQRALQQLAAYDSLLKKNIYLNNLHDKNQILFYKLASMDLANILPVIYTPIVGTAVKQFSHEFRQPRGLYISIEDEDRIEQILNNRSNPDIDLIVVSDGEGVLGIGDQGVGGMDIPVAKLMVYSLCGGINPTRTLPIFLDVGTNNETLLNDPFYLGLRQPRLSGGAYHRFIDKFVTAVQTTIPNCFLHWEDFGRNNAREILDRYSERFSTFNDDIQGTGAVTLSAILAACKTNKADLKDQSIVVFGAGTAGTGITDQICQAMVGQGLDEATARRNFWLIDRNGLILSDAKDLTIAQKPYARDRAEVNNWVVNQDGQIELQEVIQKVKPQVLIGCSAVSGAFNETIVKIMTEVNERPIILPLSNPTERAEATPNDLIEWSQGQALIATGSPFEPVEYKGKKITIAQCNNALVFPGIGLAMLAVTPKLLSKKMIWAACHALSEVAPVRNDEHAPLLPAIEAAPLIAKHIAKAVILQAIEEGLCEEVVNVDEKINKHFWKPEYMPLKLVE